MELSDNEKRDIIRYLEAGKPQNQAVGTVKKIAKALGVGLEDLTK